MTELHNVHPTGARLDGVAAGDADSAAAAHVAACPACAAYVEALGREVSTFAEAPRPSAEVFLQAVARRRAADGARRRRSRWVGAATSALALAACLALLVHQRPGPAPQADSAPVTAGPGPIRFKGGSQVAVVVDRHGAQSRQTGPLSLAPGDRIRLEIALDHDDDVQAGVLAEDGTWAPLQAATRLLAGTHYSEEAVVFDGHVDAGWVLVGTPEAVERARQTRDLSAVHAIRIRPAAP